MSITKEFDTITAISTPLGEGAIGIVRLSGTDAVAIANKVFKGKNLETVASHTINYGHIVENDETIDEVMVSVMRAPKTFTREDVVEINTHGGVAVTNEIPSTPYPFWCSYGRTWRIYQTCLLEWSCGLDPGRSCHGFDSC